MKITKNKNKYFSYLQKQYYKIAVVLVVISMFASVLNINQTFAYFTSSATVSGNTFTAGTLDITTVSDLGSVSLGIVKNYSVINQGSLPFEYQMTAIISGGSDTTFCGQLNIVVSKSAETLDTGSLSGLDFTKLLNNGTQDDLTFTITDFPANPAGKVCSFNFVLKAWQAELNYSQGFTDTNSTKAVVYSANTNIPLVSNGVVLNEFLPKPAGILCTDGGSSCAPGDPNFIFDFGNDSSHMPQGEWVELYNNSNASVDLTGWYLRDSNDTSNKTPIDSNHILVSLPVILAHGWLVVYMNNDIYNNTGDTVRLFDSSNTLIDSYSYGTSPDYCDMQPTPNDNNDTNPSGPCNGVPGNKSYARIPDGVGAWVDPIPTPGMPNELSEEIIPVESVEPEELLPSASLPADDEISGEAKPEKISPATEEITPTEEQPTEEVVVAESVPEEEIVSEEQIEEVTVVEPVVEEVVSEPVVEEETVTEQPAVEEPVVEAPVVEVPAVLPTPNE